MEPVNSEISETTPQTDTEELIDQVHESRSGLVKIALIIAGTLSLGLGILGIVLPILPTTPFLLLAAICYSRSSERFYVWLLTNRMFGQYIRDWRENKGLTIGMKLWVIFVLVGTMSISIFIVPVFVVKILLVCIGTFITGYIFSLPTKRPDEHAD